MNEYSLAAESCQAQFAPRYPARFLLKDGVGDDSGILRIVMLPRTQLIEPADVIAAGDLDQGGARAARGVFPASGLWQRKAPRASGAGGTFSSIFDCLSSTGCRGKGDIHEPAIHQRNGRVKSVLASPSRIAEMRGLRRVDGRSGGFGLTYRWERFLSLEL